MMYDEDKEEFYDLVNNSYFEFYAHFRHELQNAVLEDPEDLHDYIALMRVQKHLDRAYKEMKRFYTPQAKPLSHKKTLA